MLDYHLKGKDPVKSAWFGEAVREHFGMQKAVGDELTLAQEKQIKSSSVGDRPNVFPRPESEQRALMKQMNRMLRSM